MNPLTIHHRFSRNVLGLTATAAALVLVVAGAPLAAEKQTFLGQHGYWYTYQIHEDGARTCYMVSKPTSSRGGIKKRGDVVAFVTHRPKEGERDVVNFQAGYVFKANSKVTVKIGDADFSLFTSKDTAWSHGPADDKKLVAAMVKGTSMRVTGIPAHGKDTVDVYSLKGFTAAYKKITRACGL